jgi:hypothetical protein
MSHSRWPWLDSLIVFAIWLFYLLLWILSGEPVVIAFRWLRDFLGMSTRALCWWIASVAALAGSAVYLATELWTAKLSVLCGMACL